MKYIRKRKRTYNYFRNQVLCISWRKSEPTTLVLDDSGKQGTHVAFRRIQNNTLSDSQLALNIRKIIRNEVYPKDNPTILRTVSYGYEGLLDQKFKLSTEYGTLGLRKMGGDYRLVEVVPIVLSMTVITDERARNSKGYGTCLQQIPQGVWRVRGT